jgi:hypothetical protein
MPLTHYQPPTQRIGWAVLLSDQGAGVPKMSENTIAADCEVVRVHQPADGLRRHGSHRQGISRARCVSREAQSTGPLANKVKDDGLTETVSVDLPAVASRSGDANLSRQ